MTRKKLIIFSLISLGLLISCTTQSLIRYDVGEVLESKKNLEQKILSEGYKISFTKSDRTDENFLIVKAKKSKLIKENWEDEYEKTAVYGKKCRGWYGIRYPAGSPGHNNEICTFNWSSFALYHVILIGFLDDMLIPFTNYDDFTVEIKEETGEKTSKFETKNYEILAECRISVICTRRFPDCVPPLNS